MLDRNQIVQQALALPDADRAFIIELLEQSLVGGPFATPEISAAWSQEIDRRLAAYDRGETTAVDLDVAIDRMEQSLAARRKADSP